MFSNLPESEPLVFSCLQQVKQVSNCRKSLKKIHLLFVLWDYHTFQPCFSEFQNRPPNIYPLSNPTSKAERSADECSAEFGLNGRGLCLGVASAWEWPAKEHRELLP